MAEKLESLPEGRSGSGTIPEEWVDGSPWRITHGVDFPGTTSAVRSRLTTLARARGLRLRSRRGKAEDGRRNVKHWSSGEMGLRWTAAGMLEAERQFRRVVGYRDLAKLAVAIEREVARPPPRTR